MKKNDKYALGAIVVLGGAYLTYKYANSIYNSALSQARSIPIIGGLIGGTGKIIQNGSNIKIGVNVLDPLPGTVYSSLVAKQIRASFSNNYSDALKVYAEMSVKNKSTGVIRDYPVRELTINPYSTAQESWYTTNPLGFEIGFLPQIFLANPLDLAAAGDYYVRVSAWNISPTPQTATEANRIGDSDWIPFSVHVI
jgi:hypothetical protein